LLSVIFFSCGKNKKGQENAETNIDYSNPLVAAQQAQKYLDANVMFAAKGKFDRDTVLEIVAGTEMNDSTEPGIKFALLKKSDEGLEKVYETGMLNGSFKDGLVKRIKFPAFGYELVYYNSQDYYLGSGGGEVYSYIINFNKEKAYYAHLVIEKERPASLYLSDNIDVPELKTFFISIFRKDHPSLQIVAKDVVLKY
jgi:hypothetical protein